MKECLFCSEMFRNERIFAIHGSMYAVYDAYPVTDKHVLIIPNKHVYSYFDFSLEQLNDTHYMLNWLQYILKVDDPTIEGFNIGINCGHYAGQTINHAHIHLIPRRLGDVEDPIGGVRNVIPGKGNYKRGE